MYWVNGENDEKILTHDKLIFSVCTFKFVVDSHIEFYNISTNYEANLHNHFIIFYRFCVHICIKKSKGENLIHLRSVSTKHFTYGS